MEKFFKALYKGATNKPLHTIEGEGMENFRVVVRKYDATIIGGNITVTAKFGDRLYLLLRYLADNKDVKGIYNLCLVMYMAMTAMSCDVKVLKDISALVNKWGDSLMKKGGKKASEVTDMENEIALHEVKSNVERGEALAKGRRKRETKNTK